MAEDASRPFVLVVVMGVSGAGKTTMAKELMRMMETDVGTGVAFVEADGYHTEENKNKMSQGKLIIEWTVIYTTVHA